MLHRPSPERAVRDRSTLRPLGLALGAVTALAVAVRLPSLVSTRWVTYDDGVYGASVMAMRDGGLPFRDVFSSQGPLFLPLLWVADMAGLRVGWASRLSMVAAGALLTVATYLVARRVAPPLPALGAAALVAVSGSALLAAGPIEADGVALALGTLAIGLAATPSRPSQRRSVAVGLVLGAAVAVKSLYVMPAVVVVGWLMLQRDRRDRAATVVAAACALGLAVSLPWGLGDVWDQYVSFHLAVPTERDPVANLGEVVSTLRRLDRLTLAVAALAVVVAVVRRLRSGPSTPPSNRAPGPDRAVALVPIVWLAASAVVVVVLSDVNSGFLRYVAYLVPPLAVLAARIRPPALAVAVVVVVLLPGHLGALSGRLDVWRPSPVESVAIRDLQDLADGRLVITDEPGLAWAAGLTTPANLVDVSFNRIKAGYLDAEEVRADMARPDVCGLLTWSGRFDALDPTLAAGLEQISTYGDGRALYATPGCDRRPGAGIDEAAGPSPQPTVNASNMS